MFILSLETVEGTETYLDIITRGNVSDVLTYASKSYSHMVGAHDKPFKAIGNECEHVFSVYVLGKIDRQLKLTHYKDEITFKNQLKNAERFERRKARRQAK